jgi:hypothetical protein
MLASDVPRIQINDAQVVQEEASSVRELTKEQLVEMIEIANKYVKFPLRKFLASRNSTPVSREFY